MMGVMRRMTTVVAMVERCRVDSVDALTKDTAVTGAQLCQFSSVFLGSVCLAATMGGGRPLSICDELLSMAVLTGSWWMLMIADL